MENYKKGSLVRRDSLHVQVHKLEPLNLKQSANLLSVMSGSHTWTTRNTMLMTVLNMLTGNKMELTAIRVLWPHNHITGSASAMYSWVHLTRWKAKYLFCTNICESLSSFSHNNEIREKKSPCCMSVTLPTPSINFWIPIFTKPGK